jgi:hypothetical protein
MCPMKNMSNSFWFTIKFDSYGTWRNVHILTFFCKRLTNRGLKSQGTGPIWRLPQSPNLIARACATLSSDARFPFTAKTFPSIWCLPFLSCPILYWAALAILKNSKQYHPFFFPFLPTLCSCDGGGGSSCDGGAASISGVAPVVVPRQQRHA